MRDGLVTKEDLETVLREQSDSRQQRISGRRLGELLVARELVTQPQVAKLVAEQYELPFVEIEMAEIDLKVAALLTEEVARRFSVVPISDRPDGSVLLAIADPATVLFSEELRRVLGASPRFAVVGQDAIDAAITYVHRRGEQHEQPELPVESTDADAEASQDPALELPPLTNANDERYLGSQRTAAHLWPPLGALLIREGLVSDAELETALAQQRLSASRRLGEILVDRGIVDRVDVARLVAEQYELPFVELDDYEADPMAAALLPESIAREYSAVPTGLLPDGSLRVLIADPTKVLYSDEFHAALGVPLNLAVAAPHAVEAAIAFLYGQVLPDADESSAEPAEPGDTALLEGDHAAVLTLGATAAESEADAAADSSVAEEVHDVFLAADLTEFDAVEEASEIPPVDEAPEAVAPTEAASDGMAPADEAGPELEGNEAVAPAIGDPAAESAADAVAEPAVEDDPDVVFVADLTEIDAVEAADEALAVNEAPEPVTPAEAASNGMSSAVEDVEATLEPIAPTETVSEPSDLPWDTGVDTTAADEATESDVVESGGVHSLDAMIERALALGASSIHFSPQPGGLVVRARIDGVMRDLDTIPASEQTSVTSRLTTVAQSATSDRIIDVRADVISTKRGDKVTLRVHGGVAAPTSLTELGMAPHNAEMVLKAIHQPFGAIVVCGPTGSGRTTTLYAAMHELNTPERTITTIEDPIEHLTPGIDQIEVDPGAGITIARGLRAILRTDSDVVLVGEIGDEETAALALRAATTDYLVLSALHASSAAAGVRRLTELGIEPGALAATLTCVVAQRLVRRVCGDCRETYYATESDLVELGRRKDGKGPRLLARGRGCSTCGDTGFSGRMGLFEVLPLTDDICGLVAKGASTTKVQRAAVAAGMRTLRAEGIRVCLEGLTTAAEVRRVAGDWNAQ